MTSNTVECPKCGNQNDASTDSCSRCGIDLQWAIDHWTEHVSGPQDPHSPLILVSELEPGEHKLIEIMFTRAGYRVANVLSTTTIRWVGDALETIRLAESLRPDLIITDVTKAGDLDGIEMICRLKANTATRGIPIIVLSARSDSETVDMAIKAGALKFLSKPILYTDLILAVRSITRSWPVILLAQDNATRGLSAALSEKHWCALSVQISEQFIQKAKGASPNVIAVAFHMADANGLDVLRQLKADPDVGGIPVVMFSENSEPELEQQAMRLGAYGVYTGPLDADKLLAALPPLGSNASRPE